MLERLVVLKSSLVLVLNCFGLTVVFCVDLFLYPILCRVVLFGLALAEAVGRLTCSVRGVHLAHDTPRSLNDSLAGVFEASIKGVQHYS